MTPALQDVFRRVLDQQNQVAALAAQLQSRQQEVESITKDQARLRENMKALKGSAEEKALLQRYTRQLDSQEDRLNTLTKEISDVQEKHTQAQAATGSHGAGDHSGRAFLAWAIVNHEGTKYSKACESRIFLACTFVSFVVNGL